MNYDCISMGFLKAGLFVDVGLAGGAEWVVVVGVFLEQAPYPLLLGGFFRKD
jgi:hypothetical protein